MRKMQHAEEEDGEEGKEKTMPRSREGHINAGRVDRSPRLKRIVEILKESDHPLSSQEIAVRAYDFGESGKVMLNVSTNIGELRAECNRELGYAVSEAEAWRGGRLHWHDGRPRYRLIAAPGWTPVWTVNEAGDIVSRRATGAAEEKHDDPGPGQRLCLNPACEKPLPPDAWATCGPECNRAWKDGLMRDGEQKAMAF